MLQRRKGDWERLSRVIEWQNLSVSDFATRIKLPNAETLYRIKRGQNGISHRVAAAVEEEFPLINAAWLITGRGEMFNEEGLERLQVGYYEVDIETEVRRIKMLDPRSMITLPSTIDGDFAAIYRGDAMGSTTPTNAIVVVKSVETEQIIAGKEYLVVTRDIAALRIVRASTSKEEWRLVATKSKQYDDIVVTRSEIEACYRVVAKLIINY